MFCCNCNSEMRIDGRDMRFKGCMDIYWICDTCITSCIEEIRFNQKFRELWHSENNGIVFDDVRKFKIYK